MKATAKPFVTAVSTCTLMHSHTLGMLSFFVVATCSKTVKQAKEHCDLLEGWLGCPTGLPRGFLFYCFSAAVEIEWAHHEAKKELDIYLR